MCDEMPEPSDEPEPSEEPAEPENPECMVMTADCELAMKNPAPEHTCKCMAAQDPDCSFGDMGTAAAILKMCDEMPEPSDEPEPSEEPDQELPACMVMTAECKLALADPSPEFMCKCMAAQEPDCAFGDMGTAADILKHCDGEPEPSEEPERPPKAEVCTCPSYQSGAVDGQEMCQFGQNCASASNFKTGCPPNAVTCVLGIPDNTESPKEPASCCDMSGRDNFCRMEDFVKESVPTCGKCLYDQQCAGFQEAYDQMKAEDPSSRMATGLVYCCPDAKRCIDRRSTAENPRGVGCDSRQEVAGCGYGRSGKCGPRMANDPTYPDNCADVGCSNPDFPQNWIDDLTCPAKGLNTKLSKAFQQQSALAKVDVANSVEYATMFFALFGAASIFYFGAKTAYKIATSNHAFQPIEDEV